jgi:hypothetical protein
MENKINVKASSKTHKKTNNNEDSFFFVEYIDITLGDPITSLLLHPQYVAIGTMMGTIKLYLLSFNKEKLITINQSDLENVSGLSSDGDSDILYASIGDELIKNYEIRIGINNFNILPGSSTNIYESAMDHSIKCDNSYVLMAKDNILKLEVFITESEEVKLKEENIKYEVIYFRKSLNKKGEIKSTNYFIPLDFDGLYFCWVEYINNKKDRNLCIQNVNTDGIISDVKYKFKADANYGHINHAKLLKDQKIVIVHELNKCEIRQYNNNFELIESFIHIGDEVYAIDIFYEDGDTFSDNDVNSNINENKIKEKKNEKKNEYEENIYKSFKDEKINESIRAKSNIKKILPKMDSNRNKKFIISNSNDLKTDSLNLLRNKTKKTKSNEPQSMNIITLDIDGNVNKYRNGVEEVLFNLYKIKNIHQDHKDKQFFNMGYVYYIKTDLNYFCITTDFGCYIIKKSE